MKRIQNLFIQILILYLLIACSKIQSEYPGELKQLHENVWNEILGEPINIEEVNKLLESLNKDGRWMEIDYNTDNLDEWQPIEQKTNLQHVSNLYEIVKAYRTKNCKFYHKKSVSEKIHLALNFWLDYWLENDSMSQRWWFNEIGVPRYIAPVIILMEDELSEEQKEAGIKTLDKAKIKYSGQNKVWVSGVVLLKSLLLRNADSIKIASESIQEELKVRKSEGIQPDWSFHQHGPQLQFGNYGLSNLGDMIRWITVLRNTPFAFDEDKVSVIRNYLLEGLQWVTWKDQFDISACGRMLHLDHPAMKAKILSGYIKKMESLDPQFTGEYEKANDFKNLSGHKHFWRSDFQVKRTNEYYYSVKMCSERVKGAETSRLENIQGYHMGDGATFLYQKGTEYENIFPFWDWKKIPGTTTHQNDEPLPLLLAHGYFIKSSFVGGVSDGKDGIAVMDYKRDGLKAKKSWFMFKDKIICLGAGIKSSEAYPVATTVEQSYYRETAAFKTSRGLFLPRETESIHNPIWIMHNRIGYFFPEGGNMRLEIKEVTGSWKRFALNYPDEKIKANIFKLWFEHGINPNNGTYSYIIIPDAITAELEKIETETLFNLINTDKLQAVISNDGNLAGIVFYEPGSSKVLGGLEVNRPCIVMLKKKSGGIQVSVADPTQKLSEVELTIKGIYKSMNSKTINGETVLSISLPEGGETETFFLQATGF